MGLHAASKPLIEKTFTAQERGEALMLVGESAGFPVAQLWIDFADRGSPERPHLWAVRVFPPLQGAGLGRALMEAAERHAIERGATELELGVEPANARAFGFYEQLGYTPVATRPAQAHRNAKGEVVRKDPAQRILRKDLRPAARRRAR